MVATSWMAQRSSALSAKPKAHWRTEGNRKGRLLTTLKTSSGRPLVAKKVLSDVAMVYAVKTTGDQRARKALTTKRPGGRAGGGGGRILRTAGSAHWHYACVVFFGRLVGRHVGDWTVGGTGTDRDRTDAVGPTV